MPPAKKIKPETVVSSTPEMVALLIARCDEKGVATSSIMKLPGVTSKWLHGIKMGRSKDTETRQMFELCEALGIEVVFRVKRRPGVSGNLAAIRARKQQAERHDADGRDDADEPAGSTVLSHAERAEAARMLLQPEFSGS